METLIIVSLFVMLTAAMFALGMAWFAPAPLLGTRLQSLLGQQEERPENSTLPERMEQLLQPLSKAAPTSPNELSETRLWLTQAGYRQPHHLQIYLGIRVLSALALLALVVVTGLAFHAKLLLLVAPVLGYILPRFVLKRMIKSRQQELRLALPDALDLTIICIEAGLGLDRAIERVGVELRNTHPQLSDEFLLINLEMRAGKPRAEALHNLTQRTGVDDIRAFVAVLVQTERFGTSVANALRVHSDVLRVERRQRAEERAAKTTIKMVPALVLFIFPPLFFVLLGPSVITVIRELMPMMGK
jgi:tight adherence protein C